MAAQPKLTTQQYAGMLCKYWNHVFSIVHRGKLCSQPSPACWRYGDTRKYCQRWPMAGDCPPADHAKIELHFLVSYCGVLLDNRGMPINVTHRWHTSVGDAFP